MGNDNNVIRVQLSFHRDNPVEARAYELLSSLPRSARRQLIYSLIMANGLTTSDEHLADLIAQKVCEKISVATEVNSLQKTATGRKRGRPRKTSAESPPNSVSSKSKSIQPSIKSEKLELKNIANSSMTSGTAKTTLEEELLPDDDMLTCMSTFVGD